jgi:hypothetical protein
MNYQCIINVSTNFQLDLFESTLSALLMNKLITTKSSISVITRVT